MIRLSVFGTLELRNGRVGDLHSVLAHSKHTALLAYLVLGNNGSHRRDRLTALLWPDLDDVRARNALSKALHHLRRALGESVFTGRGTEAIGVDREELWCDAAAFEAAIAEGRHSEALALYRRGTFMEEFSLVDGNGFEEWIEAVRLRLQQKAVKAASVLAEEAERTGDLVAAAQWAHMACELSPHDESVVQRYLRLLNSAGNRTAALSAYHDFEQRIRRDLDATPTSATRSLADAVRNGGESKAGRTAAPTMERQVEPPSTDATARGGTELNAASLSDAPSPSHAGVALRQSGWRSHRWVAASALCLVAGAGAWMYRQRIHQQPRLIAVGSLANHTDDTGFNSLANMVVGGIVQQGSQSGQVDVVDLTSTTASSGSMHGDAQAVAAHTRELARNLGAASLVTGDMYRKDDSVVVQMRIVSTTDGHVLHQLDPVVSPLGNSYLLLGRIREGVTGAAAALADTLYLPWSTAHSQPPKFAAFQEFMEGLDAVVHAGPESAIAHMKRAVVLDTGFVEAKIWLLEQASMLPGQRSYVDSISAAALAQRGRLAPFDQLALDRELAFLAGRLERVYDNSRRLVAIAPSTPDAQVYLAQAAMATRRYSEAISVLHGIDLSKGWLKDLSQLWHWDLQAHRLVGDAAGGLEEWRHVRARSPGDYGACTAGVALFAALGRERDVNALVDECALLRGAPPLPDRALEVAGGVYGSRGYRAAAHRAYERALTLRVATARTDARRLRGVAMLQCELEQWQLAYDNLRVTADTSSLDDRSTLAVAAAHIGDTATVNGTLRWITQWARRVPTHGADKMTRAFILLAQGDREASLRLLHEAIDEGAAPAWNAWRVRFELQPLRGDPRFEEMVGPRT